VIPWICSPLAVAVLWRWILAPTDGAVSTVLGHRIEWLTDPGLALPVVAASPLQGAATMGMMWVGTLPALLGVALLGRRIPRANRAARFALAAALLVSGLYGLWQRAPFSADEGQSSCSDREG
jgi:multiple sugar transport system permease protein